MHLPASAISRYLSEDSQIKCCHQDNTAWTTLGQAAIEILADARMITGKGSAHKLKCVILTVPTWHAEVQIDKKLRDRAVRGRLAQSESSKTVIRDQVVTRSGQTFTFDHFRNVWFSPANVLAYR